MFICIYLWLTLMPEEDIIAAQLKNTVDLITFRIDTLESELKHLKEMHTHRLDELQQSKDDHEQRIRSLQEGVTTFKTWSGIANGGSSIIAIIALIRSSIGI